ncbi:CCA tRNA nucleotidyltransferase [Pseudalkalibacillus decolorationis]|uniref:CCA tRNA nucleotidyltransferase n=1 Tax=Pseudalkalibacillus decolorationis TaxID=163879 RepID=UPI00214870F3|nr:CCA tRNA nucleotidyltransferase [Pseudalkalibacillus decolorationis]
MSISIAIEVINHLRKHGYVAYMVGGVIRDKLLGRPIGDIDIASDARPEDTLRIFPKTIPVGIEHGTVIVRWKHESFEVTTFRKESDYADFRHPTEVHFHKSIEEDLSRRDFTINAMAMSSDGTIIDPLDGRSDIKRRQMRAVGDPLERFYEDPLRMMRAIRFVGVLGFSLEEKTRQALLKQAHLLKNVAVERNRDEFEKLITGEYCQSGLQLLIESSIHRFLPGKDYERLLPYVNREWNQLIRIEERWAVIGFCLQVKQLKQWLRDWKLPTNKIKKIIRLSALIQSSDDLKSDWSLYEYGPFDLESVVRMEWFLNVDEPVEFTESELRSRYERLPIKRRSDLAVNGHDIQQILGWKPGPWLGDLMAVIERNVVENRLENNRFVIKEWVQQWGYRQEKS